MATIGQQLTAPESGWRRYDDTDSRIQYTGTWSSGAHGDWYNSTYHLSTSAINTGFAFKFKGTKFRIIGVISSYSTDVTVRIDGIEEHTANFYGSLSYQVLIYEKIGLTDTIHTIEFINNQIKCISMDAIDIDDTGYLVHPILNQVTDINSMQIGDCIPCRYTATTSGAAGFFSELGTCIANEIPIAGTATPDGLFYLIKTKHGKLIADRNIQHSISWDVLNTAKFIEGKSIDITDIIPQPMTSSTLSPLSVVQSGYYNTNYGWHAFDKNAINDDCSDTWYVYNVQPSLITKNGINKASHYLKIDLGSTKIINRIDLSACLVSGINHGIKDFEVYISLDDNTYTLVYSGTHPDNYLWHSYNLTSSNARYVMILVLNSYYNGGTNLTVGIQKVVLGNNIIPNIIKIRSLTGGITFIDASGNPSSTNQNLGTWPANNEWDTYIVKSTLNSEITVGDNNIWHWNGLVSWCKDTPAISIGASSLRCIRGNSTNLVYGNSTSSTVATNYGFRPVLNFIESDIVSEVIY